MRENLYRGKIKGSDTGVYVHDWAFGDLVHELSTGKTFILDLAHFNDSTTLASVLIEVDPSTVGQYTGLTDKNGVKIFEGDIVNHGYENDYGEFYDHYKIKYSENNACFTLEAIYPCNSTKRLTKNNVKTQHTEIIGNIYDTEERHANT